MINYLIEKEFKQIRRNPFLPRLILAYPLMVLLIFPWAANYEIRNLNVSLIDNDHTTYSQQLTQKIVSSGYFRLTNLSSTNRQALQSIESGKADVIVEIPPHFERDLINQQTSNVMIDANAVDGTKGGLASLYLTDIVKNFATNVREKWIPQGNAANSIPIIDIISQNRYNIHLNYQNFMVPALMVMVLTILAGFLPALNIVGEKEAGTMEQMNVTPVPKFTFILAKLLPYWIIGSIVMTIGFGIAWAFYGLVPAGHFITLYLFSAIYILTVSGLGLVISNYSDTMQQAMFIMFFFVLVLILMSGLFTPINSMPQWGQWMAAFNPMSYFIQVMRSIYLKGSELPDLIPQFFALIGFAVFFNGWAVISYRKNN
jgi:ABC-2 type transport system permease protein